MEFKLTFYYFVSWYLLELGLKLKEDILYFLDSTFGANLDTNLFILIDAKSAINFRPKIFPLKTQLEA